MSSDIPETSEHSDGELTWVSVDAGEGRNHEGQASVSRLIGVTMILLGLATVFVVTLAAGPAAAGGDADFTATDVPGDGDVLESPSGQLDELTIAPDLSIEYHALDDPPEEMEIDVYVDGEPLASEQLVASETVALDDAGHEGEESYSFDTIDLLGETEMDSDDFRPDGPGEQQTTQLSVRIEVTFEGVDGGDDLVLTAEDDFDVTIEWQRAGGTVTGEANTDGDA